MKNKLPVIFIFDIGKTNKKIFLFNEQYKILYEESTRLEETKDEDGFACEDINALTTWVQQKFSAIVLRKDIEVKAVNFSAYGASFVHLDDSKKPITPLYNYLKPFPEKLKQHFYNTYGGESLIAKQTASPVLGSLNSGLQLYRLKYAQPEVYEQIKYSLHLPQYISFLISSQATCNIASIGCHTHLWDFQKNAYHDWVYKEEFDKKFPPVYKSNKTINVLIDNKKVTAGIGLHDSSAALIPYLKSFAEPFVLISTGTWCISLNPGLVGRHAFNSLMLTDYELHNDCLCYLSYEGKPVKASRLFAGYKHEEQIKRLADHFHKDVNYYKSIFYDSSLLKFQLQNATKQFHLQTTMLQQFDFEKRSLNNFETYEEAYHQLMVDIIKQQVFSTKLVLAQTPVKQIFVDGGFSVNDVYMNLLAAAFPYIKVYAATIAQASALGAALALRDQLNKNDIPSGLMELKYYAAKNDIEI